MPIHECDPWRLQYFADVVCPADVTIPTDDVDAYQLHPHHRWVYNKLRIAESQGLDCAPHGVQPPSYPVFSKPITNLRGMGIGSRILRSREEYEDHHQAGHMWVTMLEGEHISTDAAVIDGNMKWVRHSVGLARPGGMFDYWIIEAERRPELDIYCARWIAASLRGYTGMVNLETIGGKIIEVHLRFSDQWPDLYGSGWLDAVVRLYAAGNWDYADTGRKTGYSVVLFGSHSGRYVHPPVALTDRIRGFDGVSSVQLTFDEHRPPATHSMPPGGFRLAIVNTWNLRAGLAARIELARNFGVNSGMQVHEVASAQFSTAHALPDVG